MAIIIHFDGRQETIEPQNGMDFQLEELKPIVAEGAPEGSDMIEIYHLPDGRIMVLNEEGKLIGLPRNELATVMADFPSPQERSRILAAYKAAGIKVIPAFDPGELDYIAGTVLVCENHEVR